MVTHHFTNFNGQRCCGSRNKTYLICQVTLQDHLIKGSSDFMERSSSMTVRTVPALVAIGIVVVEMFLIYYSASRNHMFKGLRNFVCGSFSY